MHSIVRLNRSWDADSFPLISSKNTFAGLLTTAGISLQPKQSVKPENELIAP